MDLSFVFHRQTMMVRLMVVVFCCAGRRLCGVIIMWCLLGLVWVATRGSTGNSPGAQPPSAEGFGAHAVAIAIAPSSSIVPGNWNSGQLLWNWNWQILQLIYAWIRVIRGVSAC